MTSCPSAGTTLANNVGACSFGYTGAVNQRAAMLTISLELTQGGETVHLYDEVSISNVP